MGAMSSEVDARTQIHDALMRYCRGIDRLDGDAVASGFHPDATLHDYGSAGSMPIETFVEHAIGALASRYSATQHRISNTLIEFDGGDVSSGSALVETYVLATHISPPDEDSGRAEELHTFAGRYIDRFTEVDGKWLIAERTLRNDWSTVETIQHRMPGGYVTSGRDGTPDPLDPA